MNNNYYCRSSAIAKAFTCWLGSESGCLCYCSAHTISRNYCEVVTVRLF